MHRSRQPFGVMLQEIRDTGAGRLEDISERRVSAVEHHVGLVLDSAPTT